MKEYIIDKSWLTGVKDNLRKGFICKGCIGEDDALLCHHLPENCKEKGGFMWKPYEDPCPLTREVDKRKFFKYRRTWYLRELSELAQCYDCSIFLLGGQCHALVDCVGEEDGVVRHYIWKAIN